MAQPWNLGPPVVDFGPLGRLGETFNSAYDAGRKRLLDDERRSLLASASQGGDLSKIGIGLLGAGDVQGGAAILGLSQKQQELARDDEWRKTNGAILGGSSPSSSASTGPVAIGTPNEIESRFVNTVKGAGLTNPLGLAAVAATGRAESGFSPQNANRVWNDPSQSGQPGQAGGIMSWRAERLANLQTFAQQRGEKPGAISPETQALFLAQEDPQLIPRLNAAKTAEEANQIMAGAWRYAGYDQPGGETARRLAMTRNYAGRFGGQGGAPTAVPVQVAENEADVRRLEAQQGNPVAAPQVAQAPAADTPAPGATPAEFVIPGTNTTAPVSIANDPRVQQLTRALAGAPEKYKAGIQAQLNLVVEDLKARRADQGLDGELKREQIIKARRDNDGKGFRTLNAEERSAAGVPDDYKGVVQVDRDNQLHFPGKPATEVNIDQKVQSAAEVERAKSNVKFLTGIADRGPELSQRSADMDMLSAVLRDAPTGSGADMRVYLDRIGATLGFSDGQLATRADAINAIVQRIAPTLRQEGSGSTSDIEFKGMLASLPSLTNTPEGVQLILSTIARQNEMTRMRVEVANDWAAGDIKDGEARKRIAQIDRQSIFASADEKALVRKLAGTKKGGDLGQASGGIERTVGGTTYVQRGGQWYPKEGFN